MIMSALARVKDMELDAAAEHLVRAQHTKFHNRISSFPTATLHTTRESFHRRKVHVNVRQSASAAVDLDTQLAVLETGIWDKQVAAAKQDAHSL